MTTTSTRLGELVDRFGGQLIGSPDIVVVGIAPLSDAGDTHITFLSNSKLRQQAAATNAAALIVTEADHAQIAAEYKGACIITTNPYVYFARAAQYFASLAAIPPMLGIHLAPGSAHMRLFRPPPVSARMSVSTLRQLSVTLL